MTGGLILAAALALDAALGEPRLIWDRVPHPAVLMGRAVGWMDRRFNKRQARRAKGTAALIALIGGALLVGLAMQILPWPLQAIAAAVLLAQRSLVDHVRNVAFNLRTSLEDGRKAVSMIVGRDTSALDESGVARAAIESAAENLSDGVVAPALFLALFGLPGLLVYKMANTADSMIGYRTEQHAEFGWAAARFDDLLNLVPARLTWLMIFLTHGYLAGWRSAAQDARRHRSPNAGWPEAAMARVLGVALSGPRSYHGTWTKDPFVNPYGRRDIGPLEVERSVNALWRVWVMLLVMGLVLSTQSTL
ncbi:MAG: adenosylcobinamide-phosphate synthase CbiB [Brevirhabdus sp.]